MNGPHVDVHGLVKPLLRGRLHVGAFAVAIPATVLLVLVANGLRATVAAAVYGATLVALFGVSGAYHRLGRTIRSQKWLRRADHATIYLLIAGSYTPVSIVAVGGRLGWGLAAAVWVAAALGGALKLVWFDRTQVVGAVLYIAIGWFAVLAIPVLVRTVEPWILGLIVAGGLTYTVGAMVLAKRRPDPLPRIFGYHEVWHTLTIVAAALHYAAMVGIVREG